MVGVVGSSPIAPTKFKAPSPAEMGLFFSASRHSVPAPKQAIKFLGSIWISTGGHRCALRVLLRDPVLPVRRRVGCAAKAPIHLFGNVLVRQDGLVVPMQVQLSRCGVVVGLLDAAACKRLGGH